MSELTCKYLVIGGGIAGVSCASALAALQPGADIVLVSASAHIKQVRDVEQLTRNISSFNVAEQPIKSFTAAHPGFKTLHLGIKRLDFRRRCAYVSIHRSHDYEAVIRYEKVCVCTGARPNTQFTTDGAETANPRVITIRDTGSVKELGARVSGARRLLLVGNGGIATELAFQLSGVELVWSVKHAHISHTFLDPGAAEFFLPALRDKSAAKKIQDGGDVVKRMNFKLDSMTPCFDHSTVGSALGPDWHRAVTLRGGGADGAATTVEYQTKVVSYHDRGDAACVCGESERQWPLHALLSNGKRVGCDVLVCATGVRANTELFASDGEQPDLDSDDPGGVAVDEDMRVIGAEEGVYAAGDVVSCLQWPRSEHWFQMRLWTQAKQMGEHAARCMVAHDELGADAGRLGGDVRFEIFAHATSFFGRKVVLLGRFNLQGIYFEDESGAADVPRRSPEGAKLVSRDSVEMLLRVTPGKEYVKVLLLDGRMLGAVLIGDTDYEETFENLILNQTDVGYLGESLIDPNVDITDYFD